MTTPADALVARLCVADVPRDEVDTLACELLGLVSGGARVEAVRPLLTSDVAQARRAGAFVLSELGAAALPVLPDAVGLLAGDSRLLRYYVLDALHGAAGALTAALVVPALPLLSDDEEVLREKVMSLLVPLSDDVVAALPTALPDALDTGLRADLAWFAAATRAEVEATLLAGPARAGAPSRRDALAAVAAAVRMAGEWDGAWSALAASGAEELERFGDEQKQIAGRLRRREVVPAG
ncbi:MAG: hypothetical protein U0Q15_02915 [Kineosporiaceae bacterium]